MMGVLFARTLARKEEGTTNRTNDDDDRQPQVEIARAGNRQPEAGERTASSCPKRGNSNHLRQGRESLI